MTGPRRRDPNGRERGSASLELAVLTPVLLLLLALAVLVGRVQTAHAAIDEAAVDAARAASISRTAGDAQTNAQAAAKTTLDAQSLQCSTLTVNVDVSGFRVPVGQPAQVTATVVCVVRLGDLGPGLPGSLTETSTMVSPLDQYRGR